MNRVSALEALLHAAQPWDLIVIGGGATGLGAAVDAVARGYRVLLVEAEDFAAGTSSRSTKLIHGGLRYLQQGNLSLVRSALRERGRLCANAPQMVQPLRFIAPAYRWRDAAMLAVGLKTYDALAGGASLGCSRVHTRAQALEMAPGLTPEGLKAGASYWDAQFDDARLAVALLQAITRCGGNVCNYLEVVGLLRASGKICGIVARDRASGREHEFRAKVVINAAGVFGDTVRRLDDPGCEALLTASQGAHVVLPRRFWPGTSALIVPRTPDGRVMFAIPWHGQVVVGTTDAPTDGPSLAPSARPDEIDFILSTAGRYLAAPPKPQDILSAFAGLRPLIGVRGARTSALPRDHAIFVSDAGLISIFGGKWTTYRQMAEDVIDRAQEIAGLGQRRCNTGALRLGGPGRSSPTGGSALLAPVEDARKLHGGDARALANLLAEQPALAAPLVPGLPYCAADAILAVRQEMACTVEDVLARRTRALFLDAAGSIAAAPRTAALLAAELKRDDAWTARETAAFQERARSYLPPPTESP